MLTDARTIAAGTVLDADICIIGGGAAGLSMAAELIESGLSVILLEAGGDKPDADSQAFYDGESVSSAHAPPSMYRQRRLGGSSTIWGGRCVPFDPIDFEARNWVPLSGWPFGRELLDPFYARAQNVLDAGTFDYSAATALHEGALIDGLADPRLNDDTIERFSLPTNLWAKYAAALTAAKTVHVLSNAACVDLPRSDNGGPVTAAEVATPDGGRLTVRAKRYVVSTGGIETYRLLAHAGIDRQSDMLGRTYMCHAEMATGALQITPKSRGVSWGFERTIDGVYARRRLTLTKERQRELGILNAMVRLHHPNVLDPRHRDGILSLMYLAKNTVIPEYRRKLSMVEHAAAAGLTQDARFWTAHLGNIVRDAPRTAGFVYRWITQNMLATRKLPYVALHNKVGRYSIDLNSEQQPNPDSRITLSDERDRHGMRRAKIDWRLSELDVRTIVATYADMAAAIAASGVGQLDYDVAHIEDLARAAVPVGGHHIGTARMATDPAEGVVDADCRVHHVDNLYVAGAAVLPTSSHANPTLTLIALALRLTDHLRQQTK